MKILAIVQARMGSERLPGKVMKVLDGVPMITHTLRRLEKSKYIDQVILATSVQDRDTPLAEYVETLGIGVYRGDETNVLERYCQAVERYGGDLIIRITGDCPLIDPLIVDQLITKYLTHDFAFIRLDVPNTFLRGFDCEVFSKEVLTQTEASVKQAEAHGGVDCQMYKEHVTYYMYHHPEQFKYGVLAYDGKVNTQLNLSVDTLEDFKRVEKLIHLTTYQEILKEVEST